MKKILKSKKTFNVFIIVAAILIVGSILNIPFLPKYIEGPGSAPNLKNVVKVDNHNDSYKGKFMFTTVSEMQASPITYLWAKINPHYSIEDDVTDGQSMSSYENLQNIYMKTSISNAVYNAFHYAKKDVSLTYQGIYVLEVDKKSKFYGFIQPGDLITSLNGHSFKSSSQFRKYVKSKKIGDNVDITFYRGKKKMHVSKKLYGLAGSKIPGIGIVLTDNNEVKTQFPVKVNPGQVGGPSAGLMFSLEIYQQLVKKDIRNANAIAGTGTIDEYGNVGEIGGIDKKIIAARDNGARYFLAPYVKPTKEVISQEEDHMTNYQLAVKTAKKYAPKMKVIPVSSFSDALQKLKKL